MKVTFDLSEMQQGAISAKEEIAFLADHLNQVYVEQGSQGLLTASESAITEILNRLGTLNEYQKGFIYSLIEFSEINTEGGLSLQRWSPSLITNKWQ